MIKRFEHFSAVIADIHRAWHKIANGEMIKYGLKGVHAIYMTMMLRYPDGLTPVELCEYCGRDKAEVSRMVAILIEKGMVTKEEKSAGVYRAKLMLTGLGRTVAGDISQKAERAVMLANSDVDPSERDVFYRVMESIAYNLLAICESGLGETSEE